MTELESRKRQFIKTRLRNIAIGLGLLIISALVVLAAMNGNGTVEEADATPILLLIPMGLYAIFNKNV